MSRAVAVYPRRTMRRDSFLDIDSAFHSVNRSIASLPLMYMLVWLRAA